MVYEINREGEKVTWKTPIKRLAWQILMPTMEKFRKCYNNMVDVNKEYKEDIKRLSGLVNLQSEELENKDIRNYVFDIEQLNKEEQEILGNNHDHPVVKVLMKSFKAKADENNDKLVHFQEQPEFKRAQWALAIRVYDDLIMQMKTFGMYETKKAKKAEKEANY